MLMIGGVNNLTMTVPFSYIEDGITHLFKKMGYQHSFISAAFNYIGCLLLIVVVFIFKKCLVKSIRDHPYWDNILRMIDKGVTHLSMN
ncbi:hypothetical protein CANCADRAFT_55604 [Tortispora caseinolytica NRRL Y-17796]|uniref:Uncharacterized protein n=1 Tax=Tortispora caseinolytica NRRL Y-17796 TaxID=767744 RepID=A0A1E4TJ92_9ASCO|nr:hypothetical protein CANCADRAFT_55604 [Tortispora caseinolytica NRRL Y-17796]